MNDDAGSSIRIASNADCTQEGYSNFLADLYKEDPVHVITIILYLVFAGSLVYYVVSIMEVHNKKKRMCKQYDDIVDHYEKVLSREEIQQITDNGQPLIKAQSILKRGMIRWSIIWVLFILAAFIVIDFVGDGPHIVENTISILSKFISDIARYFKSL